MEKSPSIKAEFTDFPLDSNWVKGTVGHYTFEAKLFDDPSSLGIANGRVSKLAIQNALKTDIVSYDRGWDQEPSESAKPYYDAVMTLLESAPRRFDLENSPN